MMPCKHREKGLIPFPSTNNIHYEKGNILFVADNIDRGGMRVRSKQQAALQNYASLRLFRGKSNYQKTNDCKEMKTGLNKGLGNRRGTKTYWPTGMENKVLDELSRHPKGITVEILQTILVEKFAVKNEKGRSFTLCVRSTLANLVRHNKVVCDQPRYSRNRIYKIKKPCINMA